jgi:hypothetical protein
MSNIEIIYRIQICAASVSLLSSSFIAGGIIKSDGGLTSPYRRIIFGLSVSDILQSLSIIAGPFAIPSSSPSGLWAVGNYHTCQVDGFLFGFTAGSTPMYMFGLCLYTALKIRRNMTNEMFTRKIEKVLHFSIILLSLSIVVFGLQTKTINSGIVGNLCMFAAVPTGCRQRPDLFGECDQAIDRYVPILVMISTIVIPFLSLFGIICCMGTICWHVLQRSKILGGHRLRGRRSRLLASPKKSSCEESMSRSDMASSQSSLHVTGKSIETNSDPREEHSKCLTNNKYCDSDPGLLQGDCLSEQEQVPKIQSNLSEILIHDIDCLESHHINDPELQQDNEKDQDQNTEEDKDPGMLISGVYRREIMLQACCFVLAFFVTFISWWVLQLMLAVDTLPSVFLMRVTSVFYPLGGLFNILAYTRPKIFCLRMRNPEYSWLRAFWCVIKAGGNVPSLDQRILVLPDANGGDRSRAFGAAVPEFASSGGCSYNGSQSFGSDNIAYRSKDEWKFSAGDVSALDFIPEEEDGQSQHEEDANDIELLHRKESEGEDMQMPTSIRGKPVDPVERAYARAMERIKGLG